MSSINKFGWIASAVCLCGLLLISSCGGDEKPTAGISFAEPVSEVYETGDPLEVKINLDKPLSETIVLSYTLGGTAKEAKATADGDFVISPTGGYITLAPGASEAILEITPLEDYNLDIDDNGNPYDSIIITLNAIISGRGKILEQSVHVVHILEDDLLVLLDWEAGSGKVADMDLMLWIEEPVNSGTYDLIVNSKDDESGSSHSIEGFYLVSGFPNRKYGISYTYYQGTSNNLNFISQFINFGGSLNGGSDFLEFTGTYTLSNIKNYGSKDADKPDVAITQIFTKSGLNYTGIASPTIPASGSRVSAAPAGKLNKSLLKKLKGAKLAQVSSDKGLITIN